MEMKVVLRDRFTLARSINSLRNPILARMGGLPQVPLLRKNSFGGRLARDCAWPCGPGAVRLI